MEKRKICDLSEKDFEERVIKSEKTVVVDFYAPWCGACTLLTPVLEELAYKHQSKINVVKINIIQNQAIASKYKIMNLPTILVFSKGKIINHLVNVKNINDLEEALNDFL